MKDVIAGELIGSNSSLWNRIRFEDVLLNQSENGWNCKFVNVTSNANVMPKLPSSCTILESQIERETEKYVYKFKS